MYQNSTAADTRRTVADILSSMAGGSGSSDPMTPSTFTGLEGFSTGVLTQTTPTLTPTTLRSIEQTFIELQNVPAHHQMSHQNQAGFVPPVVSMAACGRSGMDSPAPSGTATHSPPPPTHHVQQQQGHSQPPPPAYLMPGLKSSGGGFDYGSSNSDSNDSSDSSPPWSSSGSVVSLSSGTAPTAADRGGVAVAAGGGGAKRKGTGRMGGRRPTRNEKLTPEEEERRNVRRERNKLAAARCRKRRLDHTNLLENETDALEEKRKTLQDEIQTLQSTKDELEFILEAHKVVCKLPKHPQHHHHQQQQPPEALNSNSHHNQQHRGLLNNSNNHHPQSQHLRDELEDVKPNLEELNQSLASASVSASTGECSPDNPAAAETPRSQPLPPPPATISAPTISSARPPPARRPTSLTLMSTFAVPRAPTLASSMQHAAGPSTLHGLASSSSLGGGGSRLSQLETGVDISTPSTGIFNFEALMEGGTGLTPVAPCGGGSVGGGLLSTPVATTCANQQRSSSSDLSSPDTMTPPKLVSL